MSVTLHQQPAPLITITIDDYRSESAITDLADLVMGFAGVDRNDVTYIELRDGVWRFDVFDRQPDGKLAVTPVGGLVCHSVRWSA